MDIRAPLPLYQRQCLNCSLKKYTLNLFSGCQRPINNFSHLYDCLFFQSATHKLQANRRVLEYLWVI
jgi:hypothetical protein